MTAFSVYLSAIKMNLAHGDATENTHRPALKQLLEAIGAGIVATNEPKRILCGAPDFNITRNKVPLGHVETKDVGANLAEMERGKGPNGEQFTRYRDALPNWILTDYLEFRWFVGGEKRLTARIAETDGKGKLKPLPEGEEQVAQLLDSFFKQPALTVGTAKELAQRMAGMTRIVRDLIRGTFEHEEEASWLQNWLDAFRSVLIPGLKPFLTDAERQKEKRPPSFDDMFAQTLAYGLFAARVHTPLNKDFSREMAAYSLPKTNPFLRRLFSQIAGVDMPETMDWAVDDIVELLKHADMSAILHDFGKGKGKEDPVVHFYETFLAAYDPKLRKVRGVYYTPEPVVSYIVRSIDQLLITRFNRPKGLADKDTLILDPATGTATFLHFVVNQIYEKFVEQKQKGAWDDYVDKHLLNRIFGFELLIAPYAIAHLKLGMQLQDLGYSFRSGQRLGIYLTNTLEEAAKKSETLIAQWISDEANAAAKIKRDDPILVVLGNPPYSGHSANRSRDDNGELRFIGKLIEDYRQVDGMPLGERNPKWLQNDYVKFIRFAQWRIHQTGEGIVGFITSNSYLDSPTFRGMRQSLMRSFNEIYIYDLHGNAKKHEHAPDGGEDKNVFDITEGVAILLCVKEKGSESPARVYHSDLWGSRERKYTRLLQTEVCQMLWHRAYPVSPSYFFVPQGTKSRSEYETGWRITDAMPVNSLGFQTHRDPVAVAFNERDLSRQVTEFLGAKPIVAKWQNVCREVDYRPFDSRQAYLGKDVTDRPRLEVTAHLFHPNLALNLVRQTKAQTWQHCMVSRKPAPAVFIEIKDGSSILPLYLYPNGDVPESLFDHDNGRRPNLSAQFIAALTERLKLAFIPDGRGNLRKTVGPEDIFYYAYAVFHSPTYRSRYAEFLKIDFPRLPLTSDLKLFRALAAKGAELVALHLMESPKLNDFITQWPVKGSDIVEKVQYTDIDKRVWINVEQYFGGVPKDVWEFYIGGYQVCDKWLKDRKGRKLSYDDTQHYQKIVVALKETIRSMAEIDAMIPHWPIQ
ncbi:MAG: N-6 DNA methylase [Planctomycetota bacterium]|nr:N-6 DNA methylase [Planctomycetota bacterium]